MDDNYRLYKWEYLQFVRNPYESVRNQQIMCEITSKVCESEKYRAKLLNSVRLTKKVCEFPNTPHQIVTHPPISSNEHHDSSVVTDFVRESLPAFVRDEKM